ncbi:MAG: three-Cys-motif partner protein TcmP [Planctomycetes bacterium]|nr:three-Cys-motif partner protein TcmP [Planctomycetota bacterium]
MSEEYQDESGKYLKKFAADGLPARAVGPWAEKKLKVLSTYMSLFTVGMKPTEKKKHNWSKLVYIDLFAGPSRCIIRDSETEILGSPLRAFESAGLFSKMYYVEAETWANEALSKRVSNDPRCSVVASDCNEAVKRIIRERTDNTLYLAFIDPTGLDIHFDTIKQLSRGIHCDLIINWFMSALTRNLPYWQKKQESDKLDLFFGTDRWKNCIHDRTPTRTFQCWVDLYREQLKSIGYSEQPSPYIIKNKKGAEMYWLWFASKHKMGKKFWTEAVKSTDEQKTLFD